MVLLKINSKIHAKFIKIGKMVKTLRANGGIKFMKCIKKAVSG